MCRSSPLNSQSKVTSPPPTEVVDDSEPEREQRRLRTVEDKTRSSHRKRHSAEIIELTDSDEISSAPKFASIEVKHIRPNLTSNIIEISDGSSGNEAAASGAGKNRPTGITEGISNISEGNHIDNISEDTDDISFPSLHALIGPHRSRREEHAIDLPRPSSGSHITVRGQADSTSDEDEVGSGLSRYAYVQVPRLSHNPSSTSAVKRPDSVAGTSSAKPPSKRVARATSHPFSSDFSESDLARLRACISCDLAWTARKSVAQKLKHIQSCAKKKSLAHETILILIRKRIESAPPETGRGLEKEPRVPQHESETLLEEVVKDTGAKRKGKRPQVALSVKSLAETRGSILNRARELIGDGKYILPATIGAAALSAEDVVQIPPPTQAFGKSTLGRPFAGAHVAFLPSQTFSPSRLGLSGGADSVVDLAINSTTDADEPDIPLSTQIFAPSRFVGMIGQTSGSELRKQETPAEPAFSSIKDVIPTLPSENNDDVQYAPPRHLSPVNDRDYDLIRASNNVAMDDVPHLCYDYDCQDNWNNGDALLHFVPEGSADRSDRHKFGQVNYNDEPRACEGLTPVSAIQGHEGTQGTGSIHMEAPRSHSLTTAISSPTKARAKKPSSRRKKQDVESVPTQVDAPEITQMEFDTKMSEAVLKDRVLHLRILRYEPVHFDVFVQLATDLGLLQSRGLGQLKGRVRSFLDKQAIHFYTMDPSSNRTRTRH